MHRQSVYRITVRMDDGSFRTISQSHVPSVADGDKVKVVNGSVSAIP
jgi:outer membrane lipoprotein SlyB